MYLSTLSDVLQRAQEILDVHVPAAATGVCLTCGELPCPHREEAVRVFFKWHAYALPERRPGATKPERLGARRLPTPVRAPKPAGGRGWLEARFEGRKLG